MINYFRHFFIPSETNNYRAKTLHIDTLTLFLILSLFISSIYKIAPVSNFAKNVLGIAVDINETKLLELTNQQRKKYNLPYLKLNEQLSKAAREKARDMIAKNYWAHYAPDGATPWDFILSSGYKYEVAGENLAKNFMFSDGVVDAWMASPTHRENILRESYTEMGFAIVNGKLAGEETTLVVQMFAAPMTKDTISQNFTSQIAGQANKKEAKPKIDLKKTTFNYSFILIGLLFLALLLDLYYAHKLNLMRVTGKHLAHFILLGFVFVSLFIIVKGTIL